MHITDAAIKKGKEMFRELKAGCDGSYVGAESDDTFEFDGKIYKIGIIGFWEGGNHFEWSIEGEGYKNYGLYAL